MSLLEVYRLFGFTIATRIYFSRIVRTLTKNFFRGYPHNLNTVLFYTTKQKGRVKRTQKGWTAEFLWQSVLLIVFLRKGSSDPAVFRQIFLENEYSPMLKLVKSFPLLKIKTVVDAGANIGLTSIQFSVVFPEAKIISIEADVQNFEALLRNISLSGRSNISSVHRALWKTNEPLFIESAFRDELEWSRSVTDLVKASGSSVQGISFEELIALANGQIDLFKIDIEGAEKEFFQDELKSIALLKNVRFLVIELHDDLEFNKRFESLLLQAQFSFTSVSESLLAFNRNLLQ